MPDHMFACPGVPNWDEFVNCGNSLLPPISNLIQTVHIHPRTRKCGFVIGKIGRNGERDVKYPLRMEA